MNDYFVEIDSDTTQSIDIALDVGFKNIVSFRSRICDYLLCESSFWDYDEVRLFYGDISCWLVDVIENIDVPITFWMDYCPLQFNDDLEWGSISQIDRLLTSLHIIRNHRLNNHTILIDDISSFLCSGYVPSNLERIMVSLLRINRNYNIQIEDEVIVARGKGHDDSYSSL